MLNENEFRNSSKNPFYPDGYGGKGLYPPLVFTPHAADAITFMSAEEKNFKSGHVYKATRSEHPLNFREYWEKNIKRLSTLSRFNPKTDFNFQATTNAPGDMDTIDTEEGPTVLNPSLTLWKSNASAMSNKRKAYNRAKR